MALTPNPDLPSAQNRYSRQILFAGIGEQGQQKLFAAHVAIVGCGATGAAVAGLLARAGVGTLTLIDRDYVEWSNLQRQVLFQEEDAAEGLPKAEAARRRIAEFNSQTHVHAHVADLVPANIHAILADAQLVLDATDNFETRYLLNDYAVEQNKPWIYAAAVGSYAVTMNILPGVTACLACIFPEPPSGMVETCDTSGILNPAVNLAASLEAVEAIKWIVGAHDRMRRTLFPATCGTTKSPRSTPRVRDPPAWFARSISFHISAEQAVPKSRSAAEIPFRFTSIIVLSTSRNSHAS